MRLKSSWMKSSSTSQKNSLPFSCENHEIQDVSSERSVSPDSFDEKPSPPFLDMVIDGLTDRCNEMRLESEAEAQNKECVKKGVQKHGRFAASAAQRL